jgi:hypothetical protein
VSGRASPDRRDDRRRANSLRFHCVNYGVIGVSLLEKVLMLK